MLVEAPRGIFPGNHHREHGFAANSKRDRLKGRGACRDTVERVHGRAAGKDVAEAKHVEFLQLESFAGAGVIAVMVQRETGEQRSIKAGFGSEADNAEPRRAEHRLDVFNPRRRVLHAVGHEQDGAGVGRSIGIQLVLRGSQPVADGSELVGD